MIHIHLSSDLGFWVIRRMWSEVKLHKFNCDSSNEIMNYGDCMDNINESLLLVYFTVLGRIRLGG